MMAERDSFLADDLREDDLIDDVCVILLAGGSGERLGSKRPKAFVGFGGTVLLAHSLLAFERHEAVDSIVIVVPDGWEDPVRVMVDDLGCDRVSSIEIGGASRGASVRAGLDAIPVRRQTAVIVHDTARPLVTEGVIDRVLAPLAEGWDAAIPVLEVADTIKEVDARGKVLRSVDRQFLRRVQTPQACRAESLHSAYAGIDEADLVGVTDCALAIERWGGRVLTVRGEERLQKVTTAHDLSDLERVLERVGQPVDAPWVTVEPDEQAIADTSDAELVDDTDELDDEDTLGLEPEGDVAIPEASA